MNYATVGDNHNQIKHKTLVITYKIKQYKNIFN